MPESIKETQLFRFDQMAVQVKDKVEPEEADVDCYVGLEHIDTESLKIRRWGEPSDVESSKILFRSGDIIFGKRRAYQRKLAVADFDGICSAHAMVLRPKTDVVLEEFLPFFMQSDIFMDRAVKISVGGLSPTINWKDLAKEEFFLPPLEEQRRIASMLSKVENFLSSLVTLEDAARRLLDATVLSIVSESKSNFGKVALRELIKLEYGKGLPQPDRDGGQYPVYGAAGVVGSHSKRIVFGPAIIVGRKGSAGKVTWCNEDCWPIDTTFWVENLTELPLKLIYFLLKGLELHRFAEQTAMPGLDRNRVLEIDINAKLLTESHEILEKLNAIESGLREASQRRELATETNRTLLNSALAKCSYV